jgi:hypothetical protein
MPDGSAEHDGRDNTGGCVLLEVHWDSCTVRTTTKESRYSQIFTRNSFGKEEANMADEGTIFVLTREDVIGCAREMGIAEEAITDDILAQVKKGVEWGLECWSEVVKEAINMALKS